MPRRRWGWILIASAIWTLYVWISRIMILSHEQGRTSAFKTVHFTLAAISIAFGLAAGVIGLRLVREPSPR